MGAQAPRAAHLYPGERGTGTSHRPWALLGSRLACCTKCTGDTGALEYWDVDMDAKGARAPACPWPCSWPSASVPESPGSSILAWELSFPLGLQGRHHTLLLRVLPLQASLHPGVAGLGRSRVCAQGVAFCSVAGGLATNTFTRGASKSRSPSEGQPCEGPRVEGRWHSREAAVTRGLPTQLAACGQPASWSELRDRSWGLPACPSSQGVSWVGEGGTSPSKTY